MVQERQCQKCGSKQKPRKLHLRDIILCLKCRREHVSTFTLEEIREQYSKGRDSSRAKGTLPDFDTLLARFENDCASFADIAHDVGLTRERVRQIYMKYFSQFVPRRPNGRARELVCKRKIASQQIHQSFEKASRYAALLEKVKEKGLAATPVRTGPTKASNHIFKLNGRVCKLLVCNKPSKIGDNIYWTFDVTFRSQQIELLILQICGDSSPRFVVVPSTQFRREGHINIPLELKWSEYNNRKNRSKIDWLKYLEAWHLMGAKAVETVTP